MLSFLANYVDIQSASRISSRALLFSMSSFSSNSSIRPRGHNSTWASVPIIPLAGTVIFGHVNRCDPQFPLKRTNNICPNWLIKVSGGWNEIYVKQLCKVIYGWKLLYLLNSIIRLYFILCLQEKILRAERPANLSVLWFRDGISNPYVCLCLFLKAQRNNNKGIRQK